MNVLFDWDRRQLLNRLAAEAAFLERNRNYGTVDYDTEAATWFSVAALPIGREWNVPMVSILIDIPHEGAERYPHMPPKWFWVDKDLKTADVRTPAHFFEPAEGSKEERDGWAHFCFYLKSWRPKTDIFFAQGDSLISYLEALEVAFHQRPRVKG